MKNIHLLPTDNKPSRLYFNVNDKEFQICEIEKTSTILKPNRHIYVTNDEEIKEGDWVLNSWNEIHQITKNDKSKSYKKTCKKIILTTDQDLIKDGVQAIDNEFLNWFVKNPNCEEVEVQLEEIVVGSYDAKGLKKIYDDIYKIIIPKEEPKQELKVGDNTNFGIITDIKEKSVCFGKNKVGIDVWYKKSDVKLVPKQETTLEEAEKEFEKLINGKGLPTKQLLEVAEHYFIVGYELAKERSYSDDEVILFCEWFAFELNHYGYPTNENILKALKQFKKK